MTLFDESFNIAIVSLTIIFAGLPFLALWIRDMQWRGGQNQSPITLKHSLPKSVIATGLLTLAIMTTQPALAQNVQLYVLPTENGVELYQVPSTLKPIQFMGEKKWERQNGTEQLLTSGFHTTPLGRILKVAGRIDWQEQVDQKIVMNSIDRPSTEKSLATEKGLLQLTMSERTNGTLEGNN